MEELIAGAMRKKENEDKEATFVMSNVSLTAAKNLLTKMDIPVVNSDTPPSTTGDFTCFDWGNNDEDNIDTMSTLRLHLQTQLEGFGINFGTGGYQLVDVHTSKSVLSFEEEKLGKFSGGTDFIITPMSVASESYALETCVLFEVKTSKRLTTQSLSGNTPQLIAEIIATRYLSVQPNILAILTDCVEKTRVLTFKFDALTEVTTMIKYEDLTLVQMGNLVKDFLGSPNCAIPRADYVPVAAQKNENELFCLGYKRKWRSDFTTTVAWEQYVDMLEDTTPFSKDRLVITNQLLQSFGVFDEYTAPPFKPEYLHMFK